MTQEDGVKTRTGFCLGIGRQVYNVIIEVLFQLRNYS